MKCRVLLIFLIIISPVLSAEEKISLQIFQPEVSENDSTLKVLSDTIAGTLELTLSLMGRYNVGSSDLPPDPADFAELSRQEGWDSIIHGTISPSADEGYDIELFVYDRKSGKTAIRLRENAPSILDIFDVTDHMILGLIDELAGEHVRYGSLQLHNTGLDGSPYKVYVDDILLGENIKKSGLIPAGPHRIHVSYSTGTEEWEKEIPADGVLALNFNIPLVPGVLENKLNALDRELYVDIAHRGLSSYSSPVLQEALEELNKEEMGHGLGGKYIDLKNYFSTPWPGAPRISLRENKPAPEAEYLPGLTSQKDVTLIPRGEIRLDGSDEDWQNIPVFFSTPGPSSSDKPGFDMEYAKLAIDKNNLYVRLRLNALPKPDIRVFYVLMIRPGNARGREMIELRVQNDRNQPDSRFIAIGFLTDSSGEHSKFEPLNFRWIKGSAPGYEARYSIREFRNALGSWPTDALQIDFKLVDFDARRNYEESPGHEIPRTQFR